MSRQLRVTEQTPSVLSESVYLHLRPTPIWRGSSVLGGMSVVKLAKSIDAVVEPGDYIVKLEVSVPAQFFVDAMPSARIELDAGKVVPVMFDQTEEEAEAVL